MRLPGVLWMAPIDALEQHRQLRRAQMHRAALRLWPHEATSFETLLVKIHPVPAPPQEFDQTSAEFVAFLSDLAAHQPKGKTIHVIADNLSAHKTRQVAQFLSEHPNMSIHYTPTYS